ncbi:hypothetical protein GCM10027028_65410 [Streptomyces sundarbansensis]
MTAASQASAAVGNERQTARDGFPAGGRRAERRIRAARFPREKTLREFDYRANPNVDPAVIHNLASCDWIAKGYPLCLIGDSGTGKSHLLIALGTAVWLCSRVSVLAQPLWSCALGAHDRAGPTH